MKNKLNALTREELIEYATLSSNAVDKLLEVVTASSELFPFMESILKDYDNKTTEALFYEHLLNRQSKNQGLSS